MSKFKKGQSGNPAGRPPGSKNKFTQAIQTLLQGEADTLTRVCIKKAMEGDMVAMRLCLERICPPVKELPIEISLPIAKTADKLPEVTAKLLQAVVAGELLPGQAEAVGKLLGHHRQALELADIETRLNALEEAQEQQR